MESHLKHLHRLLGSSFVLTEVNLEDMQRYIDQRSKDNGVRGKNLSSVTIKKEISTLRTIWNRAKDTEHVSE